MTNQDEQKKENENISVTYARKDGCKLDLTVHATLKFLQQAKKVAIKNINKEVSIPGFRKGKAPKDMIIKNYKNELEEETKRVLSNEAFKESVNLIGISPISYDAKISFDMKSYSDEGAEMFFSYEVEPAVPSIDVTKCTIKKVEKKELTEKEIDEALRQMQFFHATWKEIKDRPVQEKDYVIVDLESLEQDPPEKVFNDTRFEISDKGIAKWLKNLLLGANLGDTIEGISEPDDQISEEEKQEFSPKKVRVTIKKIEEATLPEINEEFAIKCGSQTVEELKESAKKILQQNIEEDAAKEKHAQINEFIINNSNFTLPSSLVEAEKKQRVQDLAKSPEFANRWDTMTDQEKKNLSAKISLESVEALKLYYMSKKILDDANITISDEEIEKYATMLNYGRPPENEMFALAYSKLLLQKTQDYIAEKLEETEKE